MHRAGLSSRLQRITQAIRVAMSIRAGLVLPSPCASLGGHGKPSCRGKLKTWNGYADIDKIEAMYATREDNLTWRPLCQGFLHFVDPWPNESHISLTRGHENKQIDWSKFNQAQRNYSDTKVVYTIQSHKSLTELSRKTHRSDPISTNALHSGNFPIAKHLEEHALNIVQRYFQAQPFFGVKVRRSDKLHRGFINCTNPSNVAKAVTMHLPRDISAVFLMSDEDQNSSWWTNISIALHQSCNTVLTEVHAIQSNSTFTHFDNYAKYLIGLAILNHANGLLVTQDHDRNTRRDQSTIKGFLCQTYVHDHGHFHNTRNATQQDYSLSINVSSLANNKNESNNSYNTHYNHFFL